MAAAERELTQPADRLFRRAEPVLSRHFGPSACAVGGGAALAALWGHRRCARIDLFIDGSAYRAVAMDVRRRAALEDGLLRALRPVRLDVACGRLKALLAGGEVTVSTSPAPIAADRPFPHRVAGTWTALEPPSLALARKIHGRMLDRGLFLARDLHDAAAAACLDRAALAAALDALTAGERAALGDELDRLADAQGGAARLLPPFRAALAGDWPAAAALGAPAAGRWPSPADVPDLRAVRAAYAAGPPGEAFAGVPTREERVAESERALLGLCVAGGRDPAAARLGPHGALLGGPGQAGRCRSPASRLAEDYAPVRLAPPAWFSHDRPAEGAQDAGRGILAMLVAAHMAGVPRADRPTPDALRRAFDADPPSPLERFWLHEVLACGTVRELRALIQETGMPLGTFVRGLHAAGVRRHDVADWINQFAVEPAVGEPRLALWRAPKGKGRAPAPG